MMHPHLPRRPRRRWATVERCYLLPDAVILGRHWTEGGARRHAERVAMRAISAGGNEIISRFVWSVRTI